MSKRALQVVGMLPESVQETVMAVGMRAMQDPHVASLATLPVALALAYLPHYVKLSVLAVTQGTKYNLLEPRLMNCETPAGGGASATVSSGLLALGRRCLACHANALEGFPHFAAAVLAAKVFLPRRDVAAAKKAAQLAVRCVLVKLKLNPSVSLCCVQCRMAALCKHRGTPGVEPRPGETDSG